MWRPRISGGTRETVQGWPLSQMLCDLYSDRFLQDDADGLGRIVQKLSQAGRDWRTSDFLAIQNTDFDDAEGAEGHENAAALRQRLGTGTGLPDRNSQLRAREQHRRAHNAGKNA